MPLAFKSLIQTLGGTRSISIIAVTDQYHLHFMKGFFVIYQEILWSKLFAIHLNNWVHKACNTFASLFLMWSTEGCLTRVTLSREIGNQKQEKTFISHLKPKVFVNVFFGGIINYIYVFRSFVAVHRQGRWWRLILLVSVCVFLWFISPIGDKYRRPHSGHVMVTVTFMSVQYILVYHKLFGGGR